MNAIARRFRGLTAAMGACATAVFTSLALPGEPEVLDCNRNGVADDRDLEGRLRFASTRSFRAPHGGMPIVVDLDGDADPDVVLAGEVVTVLHNESGSLRFAEELPLNVYGGAAADFDGDGFADVAVVSDSGLTVLLNDRRGRFPAARRSPGHGTRFPIVSGDFDADGDVDLVIDSFSALEFWVCLNRGDGAFEDRRRLTIPGSKHDALAADLDGDGILDLAITSQNAVGVLLGTGDGTFSGPATVSVAPREPSVLSEDLDGDGDVDLVVWGADSGVSLLRNDGAGGLGFESVLDLEPGVLSGTDSVVAADLDLDGDVDLAAKVFGDGPSGASDLVVLWNDGAGVFPDADASRFSGISLAVADIDLDGDVDLLAQAPTTRGTGVVVLENPGDGRFWHAPEFGAGSGPHSMAAGDLDGDGRHDIACASSLDRAVFWLRNAGDGRLEAPRMVAGGFSPRDIALADFEPDGDLDLLVPVERAVRLFRNDGAGAFSPLGEVTASSFVNQIVAADLDGDDKPELVVRTALNDEIALSWSGGDGFVPFDALATVPRLRNLLAADLDGDGDIDIAISSDDGLTVLRNDGDRSFSSRPLVLSAPIDSLAPIDLDLDGDLDLVAATGGLGSGSGSPPALVILEHHGDGAYLQRGRAAEGLDARSVIAADLDFDGLDEIAALAEGVYLLRQAEGRAFVLEPQAFTAGAAARGLLAVDLDGDVDLDLAVLSSIDSVGRVVVLFNESLSPAARDLDRDGRIDECEGAPFHRGDADDDGSLRIADAVAVLRHLVAGGVELHCLEAADADNDGRIALTDAVYVLAYLFLGGAPPPEPGPPGAPCAEDPDPPGGPGDLGCERFESCAEP